MEPKINTRKPRRIIRRTIFAIALLFQPMGIEETKPANASRESTSDPNWEESAAHALFLSLVHTHPIKVVRDIESLLESGEIRFATHYNDPKTGAPLQFRDIIYIPSQRTIVATREFLTSPSVPACVRIVALRHEVKHLEDDLAGRAQAPVVSADSGQEAWQAYLRVVLSLEWRAGLAERELKGIIDCPALEDWNSTEEVLCQHFKREMLGNGFHIPEEILLQYQGLREWILELDCASLK